MVKWEFLTRGALDLPSLGMGVEEEMEGQKEEEEEEKKEGEERGKRRGRKWKEKREGE